MISTIPWLWRWLTNHFFPEQPPSPSAEPLAGGQTDRQTAGTSHLPTINLPRAITQPHSSWEHIAASFIAPGLQGQQAAGPSYAQREAKGLQQQRKCKHRGLTLPAPLPVPILKINPNCKSWSTACISG